MHCPQCGQLQTPKEVHFCSRCGFPLGGVNELLAHGGVVPKYASETEQKHSPRRSGVHTGVLMIMLGLMVTIFFAILNNYLGVSEVFPVIAAVIAFVGGPLRILYALIFEEGAPRRPVATHSYVPPNMHPSMIAPPLRQAALPPSQSTPAQEWRQQPHTAEMVQPPSVTEKTTRLLEREPDKPEPS